MLNSIEMRKFIITNGQFFQEKNNIKSQLLEHDKKFNEIFDELQRKQEVLIIDNYIDDSKKI